MAEGTYKGVALVTGADGGMGRIHTRELAKAGYEVVMACIDPDIARPVMEEIQRESGGTFHLMRVDLGNLADIVRFADEVKSRFPSLQILLNNAGTLPSKAKSSLNNVEYTMAVNYLGHYTLTNLLHPIMGPGTRIVSMISLAYVIGKITPDLFKPKTQREYNRFTAYGSSKLALYYFMLDAAEAWKDEGICFNVSDPNIVDTGIIRMDNVVVDKLCDWIFRPLINTPEQGAANMLTAAIDPNYKDVTGKIFKNRKPIEHKRRFYNNLKQRQLLRDLTAQILADNNIVL
ncbi:MAG: SDR family NAD(P)-dependent oxidoreductase [Bacteroidales bacterium]|nr:SDR family NAD(P)-dependent oxidoreductase [Bacteroidales bacterium]